MPLRPTSQTPGLDNLLFEVGPVFNEGSFPIVSIKEFMNAKEFAEEINSGRLSMKDAYNNFWSYEEDPKLWKLSEDREWRALLPAWKNTLLSLGGMLEPSKTEELVGIVKENHSILNEKLYVEGGNKFIDVRNRNFFRYQYNPFYDDIIFAAKLVLTSKEPLEGMKDELRKDLMFYSDPFISHLDDRLFEDAIIAMAELKTQSALDHLWYCACENKKHDSRTYLKALINVGYEKALNHLIDVAVNFKGKEVIREYQMLAEIGNEKCIDALIKCMTDSDKGFHAGVVIGQKLWDTGNKKAREYVLNFIKERVGTSFPYHQGRAVAFELDRYMRGEGFSRELDKLRSKEDLVGKDTSEEMIKAAKEFEGEYGSNKYGVNKPRFSAEDVINFLLREKKDQNELQSEYVALKCIQFSKEHAVPYLFEYIRVAQNRPARSKALKMLGRWGNIYFIRELIELLDSRISDEKHSYMGFHLGSINLSINKYESECIHEVIHEIHKNIKPKGYNPRLKKLQNAS